LHDTIPLPIEESPVEYDPFYWATQAVKLRPETTPNLISREQRQAPKRKIFASIVGIATALVVAGSLISAGIFAKQAQQEARNAATLKTQMSKLRGTKTDMETLDRELSRKQQVIRLVIGERPPPTPAWFL